MQCAEVLQVPAGRGLQRPAWHESVETWQSLSAEQPKKHFAFTHQAPTPQSELKVQLEGEPPPAPPPVPEEPPPTPVEPPPVPAEPPP